MNIKDVRDMNNQEVLVEIRYLLDQIQPIMNRLTQLQLSLSETANETEEIPEFPIFKGSEEYFFCDAKLDVRRTAFPASRTDHVSMDFNAFRTSEYAQLFATKCKEIAMLLHCKWYIDRDYQPDWFNPVEEKYAVYFDYDENRWNTSMDLSGAECGNVYFETEEKAKKAADWMNKHRGYEG